jgi:hypothetical protein
LRTTFVEMEVAAFQELVLREREELPGERRRPAAGLRDVLEALLDSAALGDVVQRQVGAHRDHRQDVVEVVSDAACESPDRLEPIGLLARPELLRHVDCQSDVDPPSAEDEQTRRELDVDGSSVARAMANEPQPVRRKGPKLAVELHLLVDGPQREDRHPSERRSRVPVLRSGCVVDLHEAKRLGIEHEHRDRTAFEEGPVRRFRLGERGGPCHDLLLERFGEGERANLGTFQNPEHRADEERFDRRDREMDD